MFIIIAQQSIDWIIVLSYFCFCFYFALLCFAFTNFTLFPIVYIYIYIYISASYLLANTIHKPNNPPLNYFYQLSCNPFFLRDSQVKWEWKSVSYRVVIPLVPWLFISVYRDPGFSLRLYFLYAHINK